MLQVIATLTTIKQTIDCRLIGKGRGLVVYPAYVQHLYTVRLYVLFYACKALLYCLLVYWRRMDNFNDSNPSEEGWNAMCWSVMLSVTLCFSNTTHVCFIHSPIEASIIAASVSVPNNIQRFLYGRSHSVYSVQVYEYSVFKPVNEELITYLMGIFHLWIGKLSKLRTFLFCLLLCGRSRKYFSCSSFNAISPNVDNVFTKNIKIITYVDFL